MTHSVGGKISFQGTVFFRESPEGKNKISFVMDPPSRPKRIRMDARRGGDREGVEKNLIQEKEK